MRVTLLGTGDAAGWPRPFCTCASCAAASAEDEIRSHTSALVDGVLLLDCGIDVPRSAVRLGVPLDGVRHLLVTHDHHDHASGAALLWRRWADRTEPLDVVGPESALDAMSHWLPPTGAGVTFRPVAAGDELALGDYHVRVLAADHDSAGAVLYDVTDTSSARRLLYATDTGPDFDVPPGIRYDLLLLEESWGDRPPPRAVGHHDLVTFASSLARLRRMNAIDGGTRVVAIHLGDGNPAPSVLRGRLAAWGAELLLDGAVVELGTEPTRTWSPRPRPRPRRTLVLGGARSGKSVAAERLLAAEPAVTYLATAAQPARDTEWHDRIAAHRARRPTSWSTIESADVAALLRSGASTDPPLLVDCVTLWLAQVMDDAGIWTATDDVSAKNADAAVREAVDTLVVSWRATSARVVAVTNEVGSGLVPEYASGRRFRDELGSLNARLAADADDVILVTAGIARSLFPIRPESS